MSKIFWWIWSHSPIFCLSDDLNFGTIKSGDFQNTKLRISLFDLILGDIKLYFFTFNIKLKKFKCIYVLVLSECFIDECSDIKLQEASQSYKAHLEGSTQDDIVIERESLIYHIENESARVSTSLDKINTYATIILTILPLLLAVVDLNIYFTLPLAIKILCVIVVYCLLNICIYVFRAIKVSSIIKSTFKDLRLSDDKAKEINLQYHFDWMHLQNKARLFVSYVKNLQNWVIATLVVCIILTVSITANDRLTITESAVDNKLVVETLSLADIDIAYSDAAVQWATIIVNIETGECTRITCLINQRSEDGILLRKLSKYPSLEIQIIEDTNLDSGIVRIIQEGK